MRRHCAMRERNSPQLNARRTTEISLNRGAKWKALISR
jgi:hypothetical protein